MTENTKKKGRLFVLSAPSGSGKSTVKELVMRRLPDLVYSVSYTTRNPRPGEVDGRDYNFVVNEKFRAMIDEGDFLEWAEVFGRFYGTGRHWVEDRLAAGNDVLADLDVLGASSVKKQMPEATLIFMVPPSAIELGRRLAGRNTETVEEARNRLARARSEIDRRHVYDFLVINDDLETAASEMIEIIEHGRGRSMSEMENFWPVFFEGL
ncbi:guanylate kinase [Deltaproteobacteria bacterium Smac51]|nr:guanylate kinase [Deltaproteobacteria bacterium Smac51]